MSTHTGQGAGETGARDMASAFRSFKLERSRTMTEHLASALGT